MKTLDLVRPEIRFLKPYSAEHAGPGIRLDANESPFDPPEEILNRIAEEARRIHLNRYPDAGATRLKERIADFIQVGPDRIMVGNGSDELIGYLITAFTGEGHGVLFPTPTFSMYGIIAASLGQPVIPVPLDENFRIQPDRFIQTIHERRPQIIFLASPNNPTGNLFPEKVVRSILEEAGGLVVLDEAYIRFSDSPGFLNLLQEFPRLVILRTLSKIGMAALRVGMLVANPDVLIHLEKVRLPYNVNSFSQSAASILLEYPDVLKSRSREIISERERMTRKIEQIPEIQLFPSRANFLLFRTDASGELFRNLLSAGIFVRNLDQPGALQGCLRVTVGKPEENDAFLGHLMKFFRKG